MTRLHTSQRVGIGHNVSTIFSPHMGQIRYAARNRLCVEIEYHGIKRLTEPYSVKQAKTGNELLYVYELTRGMSRTNDVRSYKTIEITNAKVTEQSFSPKYAVEL